MILTELYIYGRMLFLSILKRWSTSRPVITLGGFFFGILVDMRVYLLSLFALVIIDMVSGIAASLHRGEPFNSRKLRTGFIERIILYGFLLLVMLLLDIILRHTVDYGKYYIAITCSTIIAFYEAGSCVENLISRFPKYTFLQKIGRMLNLIEKAQEDSTINKVTNILLNEK